MRMPSVARNSDSPAERIAAAQDQLQFYLRQFRKAAYAMNPSPEQIALLLQAIAMIYFFKGRLIELGVYGSVDEQSMLEINDELGTIGHFYVLGERLRGKTVKSNGRRR